MTRRFFLIASLVAIVANSHAQIKAKAISYQLDVDLSIFAKSYADETEQEDKRCRFELDTYFTADKLRTISRSIQKPSDYDMVIMQRLYDINSKDEYNINHATSNVILKKNQVVRPKATGKQKNILGYACKEYAFSDFRNIQFSVWVTDKLQRNVCPAGNFSLKGTALEVTTGNGLHYLATDFADGELTDGFFDLPKDYKQEIKDLATTEKKSK